MWKNYINILKLRNDNHLNLGVQKIDYPEIYNQIIKDNFFIISLKGPSIKLDYLLNFIYKSKTIKLLNNIV